MEVSRHSSRGLIGLVTFSHALQHMFLVVVPLAYPFAIEEFHVSYATLGALLGTAGILGGLLPGAAGLYQRVPPRLVLGAQNLSLAAALVLIGMAPSFALFGGARIAGAVAASPQHPVGAGILAGALPRRRGAALSWHATGANAGALAVPLLASAAFTVFGWRDSLILFAVPLALGGLLILLRLRVRGGGRPPLRAGAGRGLRDTLRRRSTLVIMLAGVVAAGGRGVDVINPYIPAYLQIGLHLPPITTALIFTVVLAGSVVGPIVAGHLADRWGHLLLAVAVYVAGAMALALMGAANAVLPLLALLGAAVGMFCYAEGPLLQAVFADTVEGDRHQQAFGIYFAVSYGAGSIWLLGLGAIIDAWGFRAAFSAMALSFLAAAGLLLAVCLFRARPTPETRSSRLL